MMDLAVSRDAPAGGGYLDALLASHVLPSGWVARIWRRGDLPYQLQHYVRDLAPQAEWRAYTDDVRLFFAIAGMHAGTQQSGNAAPVKIRFLVCDTSARQVETWECDLESAPLS
jgi:hypothetical protein